MSIFDGIWEKAAAAMDKAVDGFLSDRVRYKHNGDWLGAPVDGAEDATVEAFILYEQLPPTIDRDPDEILGTRTMLKIRKDLVPQPLTSDRIVHPKLGEATFKPVSGMPLTEGRYWLIELQETSNP